MIGNLHAKTHVRRLIGLFLPVLIVLVVSVAASGGSHSGQVTAPI